MGCTPCVQDHHYLQSILNGSLYLDLFWIMLSRWEKTALNP